MKLSEIIEAVVDFPDRTRKVRRDRAQKRDETHDPITGLPWPEGHPPDMQDSFLVMDQEGKAHGIFDSHRDATKAMSRLALKSGARDLYVMKG